jgi:hypothetical protein
VTVGLRLAQSDGDTADGDGDLLASLIVGKEHSRTIGEV